MGRKPGKVVFWLCFFTFLGTQGGARAQAESGLGDQLSRVRQERVKIETQMVADKDVQKNAEFQVKQLKQLQALQLRERALTQRRLKDLQGMLDQLLFRKRDLEDRMEKARVHLRIHLKKWLPTHLYQQGILIHGFGDESVERVKGIALRGVTQKKLSELEALTADYWDVTELEFRIEQEKQQIENLMSDLKEQENLIEFHKKMREEIASEKRVEHQQQLRAYQNLKSTEIEIEKMIGQMKLRIDQETKERQKRRAENTSGAGHTSEKLPVGSPMIALKPKSLDWPMSGTVIKGFGSQMEASGLRVFHKGISIQADALVLSAKVTAPLEGKVQFVGSLPQRGKLMIVEHTGEVFTVYSGLKEFEKRVNDPVSRGDVLGKVDRQGVLEFELRTGNNVALDPVRWLK